MESQHRKICLRTDTEEFQKQCPRKNIAAGRVALDTGPLVKNFYFPGAAISHFWGFTLLLSIGRLFRHLTTQSLLKNKNYAFILQPWAFRSTYPVCTAEASILHCFSGPCWSTGGISEVWAALAEPWVLCLDGAAVKLLKCCAGLSRRAAFIFDFCASPLGTRNCMVAWYSTCANNVSSRAHTAFGTGMTST